MENNFSSIKNIDGNTINIEDGVKMYPNTSVEFFKFTNNTGGTNNKIHIGKNSVIKMLKVLIRGINNELIIEDNVNFTGTIDIVGDGRKVIIGKDTTINGILINCRDQDVIIGEDCLFSNEIKIRTSDVHKIYEIGTKKQINKSTNPIIIGNHVWIGQDVYVGKNASIAEGCVVGTRATITKKIEKKNCIIIGTNKIIKENIYWEK